MLVKALDILLPIYVCVGFGFVLGRYRFPWNSQVITPLVLQVSFPMLVIHQFTRPTVTSSGVTHILLAAVLVVGLFFVLFGALIHLARLPVQTYLAASSISNVSIGLAVGYLGFGNSGFALCLAFGSVVLLAQFSLGKWLPGGKMEFQLVFHQVVLYALLLGILLMLSGVHFPCYVGRSLQLVGQITIPLLLLSLGFALSEVDLSGFGRGMLFATVHLAVCLAVGLTVSWALSLEGKERTLVILMSILPSSTINILMGQQAGSDMKSLTIFVTCTNLWLVVSLPIALLLLL